VAQFKTLVATFVVAAAALLIGASTPISCAIAQGGGCAEGCRAAYASCYKSTANRSACEAQLQGCLQGCIASKRH
jgi:hypothetical protein